MNELRKQLTISRSRLDEVNLLLADPKNPLVNGLLEIVKRYGGPEKINRRAEEAGRLDSLMGRLLQQQSPYVADLKWLQEQIDKKRFVRLKDYRQRLLGAKAAVTKINRKNAVTLEISALQYFPWVIGEAKRAIEKGELMPGRFIRVRNMAEQIEDQGDTLAVAAAMQILGASYVETLDTKGIDGSNIHLCGPETITGYFGGIGQPNHYPLKWVDEYLKYYTAYGIRQVLNINSGTILAAYMLHKLGINNEFKISVYVGNDNPFSILWTLMTAKLFSRRSGATSLIGFNLSNSVNNETIRQAAYVRRKLGLEAIVRFEHHITEACKSIVKQPYNRRDELVEIAQEVPNIAAKHEGGDPEAEQRLDHPSDILDYFMPKADVLKNGLIEKFERNYIEKHVSLNKTADALTRAGIDILVAKNVHE
jgi:hypothetical protein